MPLFCHIFSLHDLTKPKPDCPAPQVSLGCSETLRLQHLTVGHQTHTVSDKKPHLYSDFSIWKEKDH